MNSQSTYIRLESLTQERKFNKATELAKVAISSGKDLEFWKTQLAYVSFLNEENVSDRYVVAPTVLTSLVETNPENANTHFWLGYITYILFGQLGIAKSHLNRAKEIEPKLFYADLVLAGLSENEDERLNLLETVIRGFPNLYRGLIDVARILIKVNQRDRAKIVLDKLLNSPPYVEKNYGVMNEYMNDVFTGATHQESIRKEAESEIELL